MVQIGKDFPTYTDKVVKTDTTPFQMQQVRETNTKNYRRQVIKGIEEQAKIAQDTAKQAEFLRTKNALAASLHETYNQSKQNLDVNGYQESATELVNQAVDTIDDPVDKERLLGAANQDIRGNVDKINAEIADVGFIRDSTELLTEYNNTVENNVQSLIDIGKWYDGENAELTQKLKTKVTTDTYSQLDNLVSKGIITPDKYAKALDTVQEEYDLALYEGRAYQTGLSTFLKELQDPKSPLSKQFPNLELREKVLVRINYLNNLQNKRSAEEKAKYNNDLKNYEDIRFKGLKADPAFVKSLKKRQEDGSFDRVESDMQLLDNYRYVLPEKLDEDIRIMQSKNLNSQDKERLDLFVKYKDYRDKEITENGIQYWADNEKEGRVKLASLDDIEGRKTQYVAAKGVYGDDIKPLTSQEAEGLRQEADASHTATLEILDKFRDFPDANKQIFEGKPEYTNFDTSTVRKVILGNVNLETIPSKQATSYKNAYVGQANRVNEAFFNYPDKAEAIAKAAPAMAAYLKLADADDRGMDTIINKLAGAVYKNGEYESGGIGRVQGRYTLLPQNKTEKEFRREVKDMYGDGERDDYWVYKINIPGNYYAVVDEDTNAVMLVEPMDNPSPNQPEIVREMQSAGMLVWSF